MLGKELFAESVERGIGSRSLNEDVGTVRAFFNHSSDAAYLTFNAVQAVYQALIFLFRSDFRPLGHTAAIFFHVIPRNQVFLIKVKIIIYPPWVYVNTVL